MKINEENKKALSNPKTGEDWESQGEVEGYLYDIQTDDEDIHTAPVDKKGNVVAIYSNPGSAVELEHTEEEFIKEFGDFKIGKQRKPEDLV